MKNIKRKLDSGQMLFDKEEVREGFEAIIKLYRMRADVYRRAAEITEREMNNLLAQPDLYTQEDIVRAVDTAAIEIEQLMMLLREVEIEEGFVATQSREPGTSAASTVIN